MTPPKPVVFVSSTVHGIEELLDRIHTLLTAFGYEVWMSHKGTMPISSKLSAFDNCLRGVERCDLFLGIVTPSYGSGKIANDPSITHQEFQKAIELDKPRWILAHDHVVFARRLLRELGYGTQDARKTLELKKGATSLTDLRVIDLYEDATRNQIPLEERRGNWVQEYSSDEDLLLFATAQFSRYQEAERFVEEHLAEPSSVRDRIARKKGARK